MGADIPPVREGRGFGGPGMSPNVIILENVPGDMQKKDLLAHFSKFGHVRDIEYEKVSWTIFRFLMAWQKVIFFKRISR